MTERDRTIDISRHGSRLRRISVSSRSVRPVLGYFRSVGGDVEALLDAAGVDATLFEDAESRIPNDTAIALWARVASLTGDPDVGLHVAEAIRPGMFGVIEYVARTSPTLGVGFDRLFRYHRVLHDVAETRLDRTAETAGLSHRLPVPGGAPRTVSDFVLAAWLVSGRHVTGVTWRPLEVRFSHAECADTSEYRRVFDAPVTFGHARSELVVSRRVLDLPLVTADAALQPIVEAQASALLRRLPAAESVTDSIRRVLTDELCDGEPTLERTAERLHMSARTLHRRLTEQSTSFRRVVADVRRELAERYLQERKLAIGEIAFLLGFSEASAFHRAFKRWTGHPPLAFRQTISQLAKRELR
jgi:AraC-like DNA-binding protein